MTTTAQTAPTGPAHPRWARSPTWRSPCGTSRSSIPWYTALTGSAPVLDEDTGPFRHAVFALGGTLLGLHSFPEGIDEQPFSPRRRGLDHVAFGCADRVELVAWARRLTRHGRPHGEIVDAHYGSALSFKDPDGLPLELFCPPGS